jgi:hypothetical protein
MGALGVELRDPPVVLTGRVCAGEGDLVGFGRPGELVHVEVRRGKPRSLAAAERNTIDALDFYAVFANDTRPRLHRRKRARGTSGIFDEQEGDGLAIRREGGGVKQTRDVGELLHLASRPGVEEDLVLLLVRCAVRGEGHGLGVGREDGVRVGASGGVRDGNGLVGGRVCRVGGEMDGGFRPAECVGDEGAVGRNGNIAGRFDVRHPGVNLCQARIGIRHGNKCGWGPGLSL